MTVIQDDLTINYINFLVEAPSDWPPPLFISLRFGQSVLFLSKTNADGFPFPALSAAGGRAAARRLRPSIAHRRASRRCRILYQRSPRQRTHIRELNDPLLSVLVEKVVMVNTLLVWG